MLASLQIGLVVATLLGGTPLQEAPSAPLSQSTPGAPNIQFSDIVIVSEKFFK